MTNDTNAEARAYDNEFDTHLEVTLNPHGAWLAIQSLESQRDAAVARADIAEAMVAEALERAEELASIHSDWSADEIKHYRKETHKDHRAALDRMLREEREKALKEAAVNLKAYAPHLEDGPEHDVGYYHGYQTALNRIAALIEKDTP